MGKKYELIKNEYGFNRVKALKDFTLITGEQINKGDLGGIIESEDCLSQEGLCWIMDEAYVEGEVSGNAVVKDDAKIYGTVSGNAIVEYDAIVEGTVSGNAIVRDNGFVGENATVTGNAVVQADQYITFGTVTTDILSTKDWASALYAELGIIPKNGKVILYKDVQSTDNPKNFKSLYKPSFLYEVGKTVEETDVDEDVMKVCGKGLHFTLQEIIENEQTGDTIIECEVAIEDILTVQYCIVRARRCKVIRVYKEG